MNFMWFYIIAGEITTILYLIELYVLDRKAFNEKIRDFQDKFGPVAMALTLVLMSAIWPAAIIEISYNLLGLILRKINKK